MCSSFVYLVRSNPDIIVPFTDHGNKLHSGIPTLHYGHCRLKMVDQEEEKFENWKVSELRAFLATREVPISDQTKTVLVQNCYAAVSLSLQPKKSDEYSGSILQTKQEKLILNGGVIANPDALTDG